MRGTVKVCGFDICFIWSLIGIISCSYFVSRISSRVFRLALRNLALKPRYFALNLVLRIAYLVLRVAYLVSRPEISPEVTRNFAPEISCRVLRISYRDPEISPHNFVLRISCSDPEISPRISTPKFRVNLMIAHHYMYTRCHYRKQWQTTTVFTRFLI